MVVEELDGEGKAKDGGIDDQKGQLIKGTRNPEP